MKLCVQPSCGVDKNNVGAPAFRCLQAVKNHGRRISAGTMLDDLNAHFFSPSFELFNGCCAKCVARDEEYFFAAVAELSRHFTDGGGLADAIDAEKKNYPRPHRQGLHRFCF